MYKKITAALIACLVAVGAFGAVEAATRDEIAAIHVKKASGTSSFGISTPPLSKSSLSTLQT